MNNAVYEIRNVGALDIAKLKEDLNHHVNK